MHKVKNMLYFCFISCTLLGREVYSHEGALRHVDSCAGLDPPPPATAPQAFEMYTDTYSKVPMIACFQCKKSVDQ